MNRTISVLLVCFLLACGCIAQGNRDYEYKDRGRFRDRDYERDTDESDYYRGRSDRVLFEKVTALTFHRGDYTTGRRSSPIPALQCVGGTGSDKQFQPEVVQCTRVGFDGQDAQWRCEADLSTDVKFGEVDVSCEGYAYPEDQYILKGSCGLKYKLELTDAGKQRKRYDDKHPNRGPTKKVETIEYAQNEEGVLPLFGSWTAAKTAESGWSMWSLLKWGFYISLFTSIFFGFSIFKWGLSLLFLPVTLPLRILSFLLGGSGASYRTPYSNYYGSHQAGYGGLMSDMLGSYFAPKAYQAPASGGGFWSGIFYGGLAGSLLGRWLGGRQTRQGYQERPQQQAPKPVRIVKEKEDPRDKRPDPATSRIAAGYGGTSRR